MQQTTSHHHIITSSHHHQVRHRNYADGVCWGSLDKFGHVLAPCDEPRFPERHGKASAAAQAHRNAAGSVGKTVGVRRDAGRGRSRHCAVFTAQPHRAYRRFRAKVRVTFQRVAQRGVHSMVYILLKEPIDIQNRKIEKRVHTQNFKSVKKKLERGAHFIERN